MNQVERKAHLRAKRKKRIRGRLEGTTDRPRLSIYRSAKHMYAQVIDDMTGKTLVSIGSFSMDKRATREVASGKMQREEYRQNRIRQERLCISWTRKGFR